VADRLSNEQWEIVHRHFTIALETCQEAGLSEEEVRDEFDNALDNVYSTAPYTPGGPKKPKG
jgi:hypothetical protein